MKVTLFVLCLPVASVIGLAQPKLVLKSRSAKSLETDSGVKVNVPVPKKKVEDGKGHGILQWLPVSVFMPMFVDTRNYDEEYWYNPHIHSLGNLGILGALHAAVAPMSTHMIDNLAYDGIDVRSKVR